MATMDHDYTNTSHPSPLTSFHTPITCVTTYLSKQETHQGASPQTTSSTVAVPRRLAEQKSTASCAHAVVGNPKADDGVPLSATWKTGCFMGSGTWVSMLEPKENRKSRIGCDLTQVPKRIRSFGEFAVPLKGPTTFSEGIWKFHMRC